MPRPPNVVLILADDLGYGDIGCLGAADVQTPHTDRLAREGVCFTHWYGGAPICSASRASLLTGRYPWRTGVPANVPADPDANGLNPEVPTLAELMKEAGYQTYMTGKWHLGNALASRPHRRGFDDWLGMALGCVDNYSHVFYWGLADGRWPPRHDLWHNDVPLHAEGRHVLEILGDHAVGQLQRAARQERPFLLYLATNAPHYPLQPPPTLLEPFAHLPEPRRLIAASVLAHDLLIGRVLDELDRLGLTDHTLVWASADHGPSREERNWTDGRRAPFFGGSTGGLRGAKFSLFDGGIRVPAVLRWPGYVRAGTVCDTPGHHVDILPTLLDIARPDVARSTPTEQLDGINLLRLLNQSTPERDLIWLHHQQCAIRRGPWKLILHARDDEGTVHPLWLSHLHDDPGERQNLADCRPDMVASLRQALDRFRS